MCAKLEKEKQVVNFTIRKGEEKVVDAIDATTSDKDKLVLCRCWKSKKVRFN